MIVGDSSLDEEYLSRIDHAIPAVLVNSCSYPFSISVDQSLGAQKAMTHLLELGYRQIVYVSQGTPSNTDAMQCKGYCTALREHGIVVDENLVVQERGVLFGGIKAVSHLLDLSKQPTAIFCLNGMTAIGVINEFQ